MEETIEVYIFYFDVVGVVEAYAKDPGVLNRLSAFQRDVRHKTLGLGAPWTYVVTLYDNIWARINAQEMNADDKVMELAAVAMRAARQHGFKDYFGVCTRGMHSFSLADKTLIGGGDPTDITYQHIDSASEPQLRAGTAEKWSKKLAHASRLPVSDPCVWIGEEVADYETIESYSVAGSSYRVVGPTFDLQSALPGGTQWPFPGASRFTPIRSG